MRNNPLPRLDTNKDVRAQLLPLCRLRPGYIWEDAERGHRVACIDSSDPSQVRSLVSGRGSTLAVHDPPYNQVAFDSRELDEYIAWCRRWIAITTDYLVADASLYVW